MTPSPHRASPPESSVTGGPGRGGLMKPVPREARAFQGSPAGLVSRLVAAVVDGIVVILLLVGCYAALAFVQFLVAPRAFTFPVPSAFLRMASVGIVCLLYLTTSWAVTGSSYGARLLGLRLHGPDGRRPGPTRAVLRAMLCMLLPIGLFWCAFDHRSRGLHDMLFRTRVVYDWYPDHARR
jgi:uncharacterized RDD family membrane protein YckC